MFSKECKISLQRLHGVLLALLLLCATSAAHADAKVVVFYLDKDHHPVSRVDRLIPASEGMNAILAMYALQAGGGCEGSNEFGLDCTLTDSLALGKQCSEKHLSLVQIWFKNELPPMSLSSPTAIQQAVKSGNLASICYNAPDSATVQEFWEVIKVKQDGHLVTVEAIRDWFEGADGPTYRKHYITEYRINRDDITVISHKESPLPAKEW